MLGRPGSQASTYELNTKNIEKAMWPPNFKRQLCSPLA